MSGIPVSRPHAPTTTQRPGNPLQQLWSQLTSVFVSPGDRSQGRRHIEQLRAQRAPAAHAPPRSGTTSHPRPPATRATRPPPPLPPAQNPVAAVGRFLSDGARVVDGKVREATAALTRLDATVRHGAGDLARQAVHTAVQPLQSLPQTRGLAQGLTRAADRAVTDLVHAGDATGQFARGVADGAVGIVTGSVGVVGGGLQVAGDERVRAQALQTADTIRRDIPGAARGVWNAGTQAFAQNPAYALGTVASNFIPVGAAANAVVKAGSAGRLSSGAARAVDAATDVAGVARAAEAGTALVDAGRVTRAAAPTVGAVQHLPAFPPLRPASDYAALVARQTAEGSVDLTGLARPGIARFDPGSNSWAVVQGAGRAEKARPDQMLDLFVERGSPLPPGAVRAEEGVAGSLVADANVLSSRGAAGASPELVQFVTDGKVFDRAFVPRRAVDVPTSTLGFEVRQGIAALEKRLGAEGAQGALAAEHFDDLAIVEQHALLKGLGAIE